MKSFIIATKFSTLLFEIAESEEHLIKMLHELNDVVKDFKQHGELYQVMISPVIENSKKVAVLKDLYMNKIDPTLLKFLSFLITRNRFNLLKKIEFYYQKKVLALTNEELVTIVVASPIETQLVEKIKDRFERVLKETIVIREKIDPNILGGIKIFFKNFMIDNSLQTKLKQLKHSLLHKESP